MEESSQRRERLKAMRMEAAQEASNNDESAHSAVNLSNPLIESNANPESQGHSFAQSFNYYTDPMAAYSGNKQRSKVSPHISQDYSSTPSPQINETFPAPSLQPHINHSPNPQMQQPHGHYPNANYGYASRPPQGGNFPIPNHDFQGRGWNINGPRPRVYHGPGNATYPSPQPHFYNGPAHSSGQGGYSPSPGSGLSNSPRFSPDHGSGQGGYLNPGLSNSSGPRYSQDHGSGRGYPGRGPNFRNSANYGSGQGGYPGSGSNQGRGHGFGNSMSSGSSYGRGRGGGRGQGRGRAHNHVSAEDRPDLFYDKSMVEDPWKFLEPVMWKSHTKQWFPHSLGTKKPRVSESPRQQQQQSLSQPSLAEILAASFNEAASEEPSAG